MKMTKKILSVLLAVVMMFSFAAVAFAADGETGEIGKTYSFKLNAYEQREFKFTANKDGFYYADAEIAKNSSIRLTSDMSSASSISSGNDYLYGMSALYLHKNDEFMVYVDNSAENIAVRDEITFTVNYLPDASLKEGKNTVDGALSFFRFTAKKDGLYNFRSSDSGSVDPAVVIYTADKLLWKLGSNDNIGYEGDLNFDLTVPLEADTSYYAVVWCNNRNAESKPFTVTVSYNRDINAEKISLPTSKLSKNTITIFRTEEYCEYVDLVPSGAAYSDKLTVTVGNEKIITAEFINGNALKITALKVGKTTVTIAADSGVQQTYTVIVLPFIFEVLSVLPYSLFMYCSIPLQLVVFLIRRIYILIDNSIY